jgi:hypothetical protein
MNAKLITVWIAMAVCFFVTMTTNPAMADSRPGAIVAGNLISLKNADCLDKQDRKTARNFAAELEPGQCRMNDGSGADDRRLPIREERKG